MPNTHSNSPFAAVFLDFENIYYFFKNEFADPPELNDHILELLRNLRGHLTESLGLDSIILNAYADFERIESTPQGALYLLGVDTKNVLGTEHKNAADMRMCIDVLEVLYTRPEIGTFVLVTGDRDYIPVIQHLRRQARRVMGVGFRESVSGDLLLNLGEKQFIDARELLHESTLQRLETRRTEYRRLEAERQRRFEEQARHLDQRAAEAHAHRGDGTRVPNGAANGLPALPDATSAGAVTPSKSAHADLHEPVTVETVFAPVQRIHDEDERQCLKFLLEKLHRLQETRYTNELWLGPFLRHLADEMPLQAEWERRLLMDRLTTAGVICIEKRQGEPYPYSVVLVNYQHPDVWELNPG